jgi:hypothetical protein
MAYAWKKMVEEKLAQISSQQQSILMALNQQATALGTIQSDLKKVLDLLTGKAADLAIVFGKAAPPISPKGSDPMPNKKASGPAIKCPCLAPKGGPKKAVMPGVTLTSPLPASITLQPLDAAGNVITLAAGDSVTTTLTSDNTAALAIAAGTDNLHWLGTIPANTPPGSVANLAATMTGAIGGASVSLTASVQVTIDVPASPVAVDLAIVFGS